MTLIRIRTGITLQLAALLSLCSLFLPVDAASRYPARARHGMVVSVHAEASDAGLEILKMGGNAVDAAVAVGFALAVVHPQAGNLGGGGFMVIHDPVRVLETTLDYRETAPAAAHAKMYQDEQGAVIEGLSTVGHRASGVPGSVAGLWLASKKYGRLPWKKVLEPAVRLAREGFEVSHPLSQSLQSAAALLTRFPESRRIFLREGRFYQEGELFKQPELARTLELIREQGARVFYEGRIAQLIAREMARNGGLITADDLKSYQAKEREPIRGTYRGHEIFSMGPPSSGGIILVEMLNMIEHFDVGNLGFHSSESIHLMGEVMRRAFADRSEFLGDPDFSPIPVTGMLSKAYAAGWARTIARDWATPSKMVSAGDPSAYEPTETTHYSVVDADGGAVAATTTINRSYGSGVTIPGGGFLMNNEMDDFTSAPGVPNSFGLVQGEANAIGPVKRPLSAMTPTLVKKDGRLFLVLGSPGGPTIINTVFQIILNVVDFEMGIQEAVDAPRIHHQWLPDRILAEKGAIVRDVENALHARGHRIDSRETIGDAHCIMIEPKTGIRLGAPDPRVGLSKASGY